MRNVRCLSCPLHARACVAPWPTFQPCCPPLPHVCRSVSKNSAPGAVPLPHYNPEEAHAFNIVHGLAVKALGGWRAGLSRLLVPSAYLRWRLDREPRLDAVVQGARQAIIPCP